jgi:hypothetical protein
VCRRWRSGGSRLAAAAPQRGEEAAARHVVLHQRLSGAELATTGPVEKVVASHSGGEGRREAWWRKGHKREEGKRERVVKREAR